MTQSELESVVDRILSGIRFFRANGQLYKILDPTPEQKVLAQHMIEEACQASAFDHFIPREEAELIFQRNGLWTNQDNSNIENSEKHLDDLKIALYKTMMSQKKQKQIKRQIEGVRTALNEAYFKREEVYGSTLERHKDQLKVQFLTAINIRDLDGNQIYTIDNFWSHEAHLMNRAVDYVNTNFIPQDQVREASRKQPWRSYWNSVKANVFNKPVSDLNNSQRLIITFSQMYDNAYQHPETPPDNVFEDDDLFDGWMLFDKKKREREQKQQTIDSTVGNKGSEVFVMAHDQDEANEIFDVNHDQERFQMKRRLNQIKNSEQPIDDINLIDNQEKLRKLVKR